MAYKIKNRIKEKKKDEVFEGAKTSMKTSHGDMLIRVDDIYYPAYHFDVVPDDEIPEEDI